MSAAPPGLDASSRGSVLPNRPRTFLGLGRLTKALPIEDADTIEYGGLARLRGDCSDLPWPVSLERPKVEPIPISRSVS